MAMSEEAWTPEGAATPDYTGVPIRKPKKLTRPKPKPIPGGKAAVGINQARQHAAKFAPRQVGVGAGTTAPVAITDSPVSGSMNARSNSNPALAQEGQREGWWGDTQGEYRNARYGEDFARGATELGMAQMGPDNTANQYFQQFQNQIGQDPGLGAYYDRAKTRTSADMNQQLASRGAYGSSVGLGMVGDAMAGLDAQRAKEEADYMLQQQDLGGLLAGQAGRSMMDWTGRLSDVALGGDRAAMERLSQGMIGATSADAGFLDRDRAMWDQIFGATGMATGTIGGIQGNELTADQDLFESARNIELGYGAEGLNQVGEADERGMEKVGILGKILAMGGG